MNIGQGWKMARFDLKNTSRNRSNWIVTKTYFEPAYFNITHIPVQRAFTVFSKYSGQSSMISLTWKIASTSLFRFLQFSCNCCCSTICLPAGGLFSNFSWREGKKKTLQQPARSALTNVEAVRKIKLFLAVFVPFYTRLHCFTGNRDKFGLNGAKN